MTSMSALCQADAAVGKHLPEGLIAHHEMSDGFPGGLMLAIRRGEADEMHDGVVDNDFDLSKEQCWLHGDVPSQMIWPQGNKHHHGGKQSETIDFRGRTVFPRNGFQAVSLLVATNLAALVDETAKCLFRHRGAHLQPCLVFLSADRRKFGPKEQTNNIFLYDLNSVPRHEKTGQRLRFGKFRRLVVAVGLHLLSSSTSSSRAVSPVPRERRLPKAGMVVGLFVPFDMAHHSFSIVRSLQSQTSSVAGSGDSNDPFGPLGNVFRALRIKFRAPQPGQSHHV